MIELGSIGIVTSSAVPRMPSGPAFDDLDRGGGEVGQIDVLAGRDREL